MEADKLILFDPRTGDRQFFVCLFFGVVLDETQGLVHASRQPTPSISTDPRMLASPRTILHK